MAPRNIARAKPLGWTALLVLILGSEAHAYMDPGTGSYIFQLLLAGLLGALFAIKTYWRSLKGLFRNLLSKDKHVQQREEP